MQACSLPVNSQDATALIDNLVLTAATLGLGALNPEPPSVTARAVRPVRLGARLATAEAGLWPPHRIMASG
jgi:hypothetical protein